MNLNGDYISDALATQVGGIELHLVQTLTMSQDTLFSKQHMVLHLNIFGLNKVNPSSELLSSVLMLEHLGWQEAADKITDAIEATIASKVVTYDFARLMDDATEVSTSEFVMS